MHPMKHIVTERYESLDGMPKALSVGRADCISAHVSSTNSVHELIALLVAPSIWTVAVYM